MKKSFSVVGVLGVAAFLLATNVIFADNSTPTASTTSSGSSSKGTKQKKKKGVPTPTPQATAAVTVQPTPQALVKPTVTPKASSTTAPMAVSNATLFSGNGRLYDRVGAPGDLQKAISAAAKAIGMGPLKHDKSVFLWLGRVTNGSDSVRDNSYIRFNLDAIAFTGPRKPSLILTGIVSDQSGSDCKAGDSIEVAVDF